MAKYTDLSIDGTSDKVNSNEGFVEVGATGMKTTDITDSAVVNEIALNKMATSIPTPFARLYLYNTAFAELNAREAEEGLKGRAYKAVGSDLTLYHHLVAECLDLLEFIFEYGADRRFTIQAWNVEDETSRLGVNDAVSGPRILEEDSEFEEDKKPDHIGAKHEKLGQALRDAVHNTTLRTGTSNTIYIFKWDNVVIGGTTPFTLVYVSPNWRRKMAGKGWEFYGGRGNRLFAPIDPTTKVHALSERSADFRMFVYALVLKYGADFSYIHDGKPGKLMNMYTYIHNTLNGYENTPAGVTQVFNDYTAKVLPNIDAYFSEDVSPLKPTSTRDGVASSQKVKVGQVEFFTKSMKPDAASDYMIRPTVAADKLPVEETRAKVMLNMAETLPLVLSSRSLGDRHRYWHRTPYRPQTLPVHPDQANYFERTLPGVPGNPQYPYITDADIFEDSIMNLGYAVNGKRFFTGYNGACQFLLPLKTTLFKYFRVEDIRRMVRVEPEGYPVCMRVNVYVSIPVKGGTVEMSRTYEAKEPGQFLNFSKEGEFKIGVFPFYTYAGTEAADEDIYKVLVARMTDLELEFYNEDFVHPLGSQVVSKKIRTEEGSHVTEYYTVGTPMKDAGGHAGTFTAIRVVKNGIGGMVIPMFRQAKVSKDKYVVCVDFGTANTNVAYALTKPHNTSEGSEMRITDAEIRTLEYGADASQMALLNEPTSEGEKTQELNPLISQEFVPEAIGAEHLKFPMRTIACTRYHQNDGEQELFGDVSFAFTIDKYGNSKKVYSYPTDLKWCTRDKVRHTTRAIFQELMWLCKNKVAELGGDPEFEFYYTYPQTMQNAKSLGNDWKETARRIRTRAKVFERTGKVNLYEGIAPWYRAVSKPDGGVYYDDKFLNIDIGGGSTDIIFIQGPVKNSDRVMQGYSFSAKFAANDLWGDGVSGHDKTNGYLKFFENVVKPKLNTNAQQDYDAYKAAANSSEDVMGYIFANCSSEFPDELLADDNMRLPMLMHFAATIYYVGRTLAMAGRSMPQHIYFSGMGSLYIKYITEETNLLANMIRAIFQFAGLKTEDKDRRPLPLSVNFTENPKKVTAEGALLMYNATKERLTDKMVNSKELNYYLYDGEEDEEAVEIKFENLDDYEARVLKEVEKFIDLFSNREFKRELNKLEGNIPQWDKETFKSWAKQGYGRAKAHEYPSSQGDKAIQAVLFFWPLKNALYELSRKMASESVPQTDRKE